MIDQSHHARAGKGQVDAGVSRRQAIGSRFQSARTDTNTVTALLAGSLTLSPHPAWTIPSELTWDEDPFKQTNWRFQLHCLHWIDPLRRVALLAPSSTVGKQASALWNHMVRSWVAAKTRSSDGVAWGNMATGLRAITLVLGYPILEERTKSAYVETLVSHSVSLADPRNRGRHNHAMHHAMGQFVLSRFLRDMQGERQSLASLSELVTSEYDDQGTNREGAPGYHLLNYKWWTQNQRRLEAEGVALDSLEATLDLAASNLIHAVRPDGQLEYIGDTKPSPLRLQTPEGQYVSSKGRKGTAPASLLKILDAGYLYGRSGWGLQAEFTQETFYSMRFGRRQNHGHSDGGSITVFAKGVPWVVDPGMHSYNHDHPMRRWAVGRTAHNVVHVPGLTYSRDGEVELTWSRETGTFHDAQVLDRGYEGTRWTRRLIYCKEGDFFVVIDRVWSAEARDVQQLWHFAPGAEVSLQKSGASVRNGSSYFRVDWAEGSRDVVLKGEGDPVQGWSCQNWMEKTPAPALIRTRVASRSARFVTVLAPGGTDRVLKRARKQGNVVDLMIAKAGETYHFRVDAEESLTVDRISEDS